MNSVEKVRKICKERKIPISKLERDLGYSNGYIGQLKKGVFPANRLKEIANYLYVSTDFLIDDGDMKDPQKTEFPISVNSSEFEIIHKYRELDSFGKNNVNQLLENEYSRCKAEAFWEKTQPTLFDLFAPHEQEESIHSFTSPKETTTDLPTEKVNTNHFDMLKQWYEFCQNNPFPNAAHARTDIQPTADDVKHDEDIMDDENF